MAKKRILSYLQMGNVQNDYTVVFIHGATMTKNGMAMLAEHFSQYNCIVFDLPAHGESDGREPKDILEFVEAIEESVEELRKVGKVRGKLILAGYSMGGAITCEIVIRRKLAVNGIVLLSTGANLDKYTPLIDEIKKKPMSEFHTEDVFAHAFGQDTTEEQVTGILKGLAETMVSNEIGYQDLLIANSYHRIEMLKKVKIPAMIVHGDDDEIILAKSAIDLWDSLKDSQLLMLPYRGHTAIFEETEVVVKEVSSFINKL